jgi:hypothetical protein
MIHCESIIVTQHQETETNRQNLRLKKQITRKSHNAIDNRRREERRIRFPYENILRNKCITASTIKWKGVEARSRTIA